MFNDAINIGNILNIITLYDLYGAYSKYYACIYRTIILKFCSIFFKYT